MTSSSAVSTPGSDAVRDGGLAEAGSREHSPRRGFAYYEPEEDTVRRNRGRPVGTVLDLLGCSKAKSTLPLPGRARSRQRPPSLRTPNRRRRPGRSSGRFRRAFGRAAADLSSGLSAARRIPRRRLEDLYRRGFPDPVCPPVHVRLRISGAARSPPADDACSTRTAMGWTQRNHSYALPGPEPASAFAAQDRQQSTCQRGATSTRRYVTSLQSAIDKVAPVPPMPPRGAPEWSRFMVIR